MPLYNFMTVGEVAKLLKLNVLTVYEYIRTGQLQAIKLGRNYRIEKHSLYSFIKKHETKSI